jgi:hypothetical protein
LEAVGVAECEYSLIPKSELKDNPIIIFFGLGDCDVVKQSEANLIKLII